ncbi:MAG: DnaK suppressor protein [Cocleimonas sp.]|jgi:DnaK suppressor protein
MNTTKFKNELAKKLIEQQAVLKSASDDAESIRRPHCRDLWEIAEETERAVIVDNTLQQTQQNIKHIEIGLSKIEKGDYGFCEECGDDISSKRLSILPEAAFCQSCQSKND